MAKFTKSNTELGDIHAPVEDTDLPVALILLVVIMFLAVGGLVFMIMMTVAQVPR